MTENYDEKSLVTIEKSQSDDFKSRINVAIKMANGVTMVSRSTGFSQSVIRKWRSGQSDPTRKSLVALARVSGVSLQWLATGEGPMRAGDQIGATADKGTRQAPTEEPGALIDGELFDIVIQSFRGEGSGFESVKLDPYADRIVAIYNAVVRHPRSQWVPRARLQVARLAQIEIQRHIEFTQSRVGEQPMYKDLLDVQQKELQALAAKEARLLKEVERLGS